MAILTFDNVAITGLSACVPQNRIDNRTLGKPFESDQLLKTIKTTGIAERRVASSDVCASDLCVAAASGLMADMAIPADTIDMLLFVSQSPDFRVPATAPLLQHRLGLSKAVGAFDINMGCSGYIYGLSTAFLYAAQPHIRRVLLLVGDTPSKYVSSQDKTTGMLFGDGGTATLIEKRSPADSSWFSVNSDGSGEKALKIPAGGYRQPSSPETVRETEREDGSVKSDEQLTMDGGAIFNFTIKRVPADIRNVLSLSGTDMDKIDYLIYHQANRFITDHLTKKLKFPKDKVPYCLDRFGNTTCLTIPLTIVSEIKDQIVRADKRVILSGFGIGLSWATALVTLGHCHVSPLMEV